MPDAPTLVALCPECRRVVACSVQNPKHAKDTAKAVASWARDGLTITTMPVEEVRAAEWGHVDACLFGRAASEKRKAKKGRAA